MAPMAFDDFFATAMGTAPDGRVPSPHAYQRRLADEGLPELLAVPTGTGKTAAAVLPHLYRRRAHHDPAVRAATARRLVVVLPQRTLVEQTVENVRRWLTNLGLVDVGLHVLMGGASTSDREWKLHPERDAVFVGTQDMVVSRLLMRGYGESRASWPLSFGLLHADTQFVFDEVQLMGPALPTSLQLEGLRRAHGTFGATRSMWMSATVPSERMKTPDHPGPATIVGLGDEDLAGPLAVRLNATRTVRQLVVPDDADREAVIADAVIEAHAPATRTIVVLNTVARACLVHRALEAREPDAAVVLVHSRFRPDDRAAHLAAATAPPGPAGTIVVTTQVLEAGVDTTSRLLVTEVAPWSSITQRAGRCNRGGEHASGEAELWWVATPASKSGHLPYDEDDLAATVTALTALEGAAVTSTDLGTADVAESDPVHPVLRRSDLLDLFDTSADLGGNAVDVSRWVRDAADRTVPVAWRPIDNSSGPVPVPDDKAVGRSEVCPAPVEEVKKAVAKRRAFVFDPVTSQWQVARPSDVRPGTAVILDAAGGGYDRKVGWSPTSKAEVQAVVTDGPLTAGLSEDRATETGHWVTLRQHLLDTEAAAKRLVDQLAPLAGLGPGDIAAIVEAATWHDLGKAHPTFVERLQKGAAPPDPAEVYAKSPERSGRPTTVFRHELASALMLLERPDLIATGADPFLVTYLVAAHHGKVRMTIRSCRSDMGKGSVLGVAEGDHTNPTGIPRSDTPLSRIDLQLDSVGMGATASGPSWQHRTARLRDDLGPFRLAFLEAIVRMADWRASAGLPEEVEA